MEQQRQKNRLTLKPIGRATPGYAIPEDNLADIPPVVNPANLHEKPRSKCHPLKEHEPIRMIKGQLKFNPVTSLRDIR